MQHNTSNQEKHPKAKTRKHKANKKVLLIKEMGLDSKLLTISILLYAQKRR